MKKAEYRDKIRQLEQLNESRSQQLREALEVREVQEESPLLEHEREKTQKAVEKVIQLEAKLHEASVSVEYLKKRTMTAEGMSVLHYKKVVKLETLLEERRKMLPKLEEAHKLLVGLFTSGAYKGIPQRDLLCLSKFTEELGLFLYPKETLPHFSGETKCPPTAPTDQ